MVKAPIEQVGAHLEALKESKPEGITPADVVEDAIRPDSPIHSCFTWNDSEAARKQRLQEARCLLRSYEVTVVSQTDKVTICPSAVRVITPEQGSAYLPTSSAMSREDYRKQVLAETSRQLRGISDRLRKLEGMSPKILSLFELLCRAIDSSLKSSSKKAEKRSVLRN